MIRTVLFTLCLAASSAASAQEFTKHETQDSFDDVTFAVESAILSAGLVIDHTSHVGDMLERTRNVTGSDRVLFTGADVFLFCSAAVSRQVMEADPANLNFCPYAIRVYETPENPGTVVVSHQSFSGSMAPVQDLLEGIVTQALN